MVRRIGRRSGLSVVAIAWLAAMPLRAQTPDEPERATGLTASPAVHSARAMVVTANPHATQAALHILREGGSAVDAAIAAALVLGVVEPQSSGLGGGGFALHYATEGGVVEAWDGRETAPRDVDASLFLGADGAPMAFYEAALGGRAVGVPGLPRLLAELHARHGRLPWVSLFQPAIRLAEEGFRCRRGCTRWSLRTPTCSAIRVRALLFDAAGGRWRLGRGSSIPPWRRRCASWRTMASRPSTREACRRSGCRCAGCAERREAEHR